MGLKDGQIDYRLVKPCEIITPEGPINWTFAVLFEPTNQHAKYYIKIEDMLGKALLDSASLSQADPKEELEKTSGEEVKNLQDLDEKEYEESIRKQVPVVKLLLINSDRVDREKFLAVFERMILATTDRAIVNCEDQFRLKKSYWNALALEDQLGIAYLWSAFFVMPSLQKEIE